MATTFDVYPGGPHAPSFRALLTLGEAKFHRFLQEQDLSARPRVTVRLQRYRDHTPLPLDLDAPFGVPEEAYAWFTLVGVDGGTDASSDRLDAWDFYGPPDYGLPFSAASHPLPDVVETARTRARGWSFRRSAGQPASINILYGCLASALAELTDGIVWSGDGAWDFERFPARADEFDTWYMRPGRALSEEARAWSTRITARLAEDWRDAP